MKNGNCIVVDLDGTLIQGNSFVELTKFLLKKLLNNGNLPELSKILFKILLRKLRLISHKNAKYFIVGKATSYLKICDLQNFLQSLIKKLNPQVLEITKDYDSKGYTILIATAAPDLYLPYLLNKLPLKNVDYIATPFTKKLGEYEEVKGKEKLNKVKKYLKKNSLECILILSDHYEDLPLFKDLKSKIILVNPSKLTTKIIKGTVISQRTSLLISK